MYNEFKVFENEKFVVYKNNQYEKEIEKKYIKKLMRFSKIIYYISFANSLSGREYLDKEKKDISILCNIYFLFLSTEKYFSYIFKDENNKTNKKNPSNKNHNFSVYLKRLESKNPNISEEIKKELIEVENFNYRDFLRNYLIEEKFEKKDIIKISENMLKLNDILEKNLSNIEEELILEAKKIKKIYLKVDYYFNKIKLIEIKININNVIDSKVSLIPLILKEEEKYIKFLYYDAIEELLSINSFKCKHYILDIYNTNNEKDKKIIDEYFDNKGINIKEVFEKMKNGSVISRYGKDDDSINIKELYEISNLLVDIFSKKLILKEYSIFKKSTNLYKKKL